MRLKTCVYGTCIITDEMCPYSFHRKTYCLKIIEPVDTIGRDGPDTPIYAAQYKRSRISAHTQFHLIRSPKYRILPCLDIRHNFAWTSLIFVLPLYVRCMNHNHLKLS